MRPSSQQAIPRIGIFASGFGVTLSQVHNPLLRSLRIQSNYAEPYHDRLSPSIYSILNY